MLISLSKRPGSGEVMVHPLGNLSVRQQVLPLGIQLDRYGGGIPSGARSFVARMSVSDMREHWPRMSLRSCGLRACSGPCPRSKCWLMNASACLKC